MAIKSAEMKLIMIKKNFKPNEQIRNPTNQSIYKREKDEHIKHPSCHLKKVYFQETTLPNR